MCIVTAVFASLPQMPASHVLDAMATDTITVGNLQKTASFAASLAHMRHTLRCDAHMMHTLRSHRATHTGTCAHMRRYGQGPAGGT